MKGVDDDHGVADISMGLVLQRSEREVTMNGLSDTIHSMEVEGTGNRSPGEMFSSYINVQATIPGRPLWKSFTSPNLPSCGLNSMPI